MAESSSPESDRFLTVEEVARTFRLSVKAVRSAIQRGELRAVKLCNRWRVPQSAVVAWVEQSVFVPAPAGMPAHVPPRPGAALHGSRERLRAIEQEATR